MAYPAVAINKARSLIFHAPGALVPHKKGACSSFSEEVSSDDGIKSFYMIFDCLNEDPCSFVCVAMNKSTGEATPLTISPSPHTKKRHSILLNFTVVAVGSTIYLIGGYCCLGFCPDGVRELLHQHAEVICFNTLQPDQGWKNAPHLLLPRINPTAVVVEGRIFVFGGSGEVDDGEFFDPETNQWCRFPAEGFHPCFPCIHVPHVDSHGVKSVLVHSDHGDGAEILHRYLLVEQKWEIVSCDFGKCLRPGAILGEIVYTVLDCDDEEKPVLHGYHLVHKRWFPVALPEMYKITTETACVFASGSDRLCLMWYHFDARGRGKDNRMECLELKLNQDTKTHSDGTTMLLNLSATIVSNSYFCVQYTIHRKTILAL